MGAGIILFALWGPYICESTKIIRQLNTLYIYVLNFYDISHISILFQKLKSLPKPKLSTHGPNPIQHAKKKKRPNKAPKNKNPNINTQTLIVIFTGALYSLCNGASKGSWGSETAALPSHHQCLFNCHKPSSTGNNFYCSSSATVKLLL